MSVHESEWGINKTMCVLAICFTVAVGSCNATLIAERWGASDDQVRKACVYKTGNPECKR